MTETAKKIIELPIDDVEWFERTFPAHGKWTMFFRESLQNLRKLYDEQPTPNEMLEMAVREVDMEDEE